METDHRHFYLEGKKFFPSIHEMGNTKVLLIPYLAEDKAIENLLITAKEIASQGIRILWELELPFAKKPLFIQDTSYFFSLGLWLKELMQKLYIPLAEHTIGVVLFRGSCDFASYFLWTEQQELLFQERITETPGLSTATCKFFFAGDVLAEYLQRLCSFLPDSLPAFCLLDASSISLAELAFFATKERFGHLLLGISGSSLPIGHLTWEYYGDSWVGTATPETSVGICLPPLEKIKDAYLSETAEVLKSNASMRILTETYLHESWDGLDELIIFPELISPQGKRKVQGFIAAGGLVSPLPEFLHIK